MNPALSPPAPEAPWYRHPLVWLVIALPASAIIGGLVTLAIAITYADSTVDDNWYRDGKAINRSLEAENRAARLGLSAALDQDGRVRLSSQIAVPWPDQLELSLRHPAFADRDRHLLLRHLGDGLYAADDALPEAGEWSVTLAPPGGAWRLYHRLRLGPDGAQLGAMGPPR
ncbi:FixH family protein [Alloalcanivorax gelatiniphagus]|uniref:FixH family protein n=1 Tax=Alloalcanivorax gelatiniphagus TaxID=1194167 RepID=A0ABY2XR18_9GAMM|nr:FixH family protein [Alloalcanivorax gelatiniphagus]TMW14192.1 FixH family protein [Alloalcanivorax gelatiniphagus]